MQQNYLSILFLLWMTSGSLVAQTIPLPEHPRPDFERTQWQNLNGSWDFRFDSLDLGQQENWQQTAVEFPQKITVPFPWGSQLSGVADEADIAWYRRTIQVKRNWSKRRTFLTIGASDWETTVWLDGQLVGTHRGGYVPFSFELTDLLRYGEDQQLVIRVDDKRRDFTLYGKQGYGNARGIWQTIYLEARGQNYVDAVHFTPNIDSSYVEVTTYLGEPATTDLPLEISIKAEHQPVDYQSVIPKGQQKFTFLVDISTPRLWRLKDPFLHLARLRVGDDEIRTYFGMRKVSVERLPGTDIPYIALNGVPIYLQLALDQSYHPDGFYTFPSDQFLQEEILRSKAIGLNGIRTHIKVEVPRKLYWADKLGLLVMEDLPNSWGEPNRAMRDESTYTLKKMIKRDYNHPSIFSWVVFNETWGLFSNVVDTKTGKTSRQYLPTTQNWVASMYYLAKSLDPTRLVEDNSICCGRGHTETDIYSWHVYLPGWAWDEYLDNLTANNYPGSAFDFEDGWTQGEQPNINSECGNVWGYDGSTGDVDWSWDYHRMINTFRQYPKVAGWLYTEHHDVINEWNGYWRFDRSEKETGLGDLMPGMSLVDLHAPVYLSTGNDICWTATGGETVVVPLHLSSMTRLIYGDSVLLSYELVHDDYLGEQYVVTEGSRPIAYQPWMQDSLPPLRIQLPELAGVATLRLKLTSLAGNTLHRNFVNFEVTSNLQPTDIQIFSQSAADFSAAEFSKKQWTVLDGKKVNGAGTGYFEYTIPLARDTDPRTPKSAEFLVELSAKELFVKDQQDFDNNQDYMKGSRVAPSSNPNAYPMSDTTMFPSTVRVLADGQLLSTIILPDDPADHRGVLSWHHQLRDRRLREAGSYGYLQKIELPLDVLKKAMVKEAVTIRLETAGTGGIAVYGDQFGRYAVRPSVVVRY